MAKQLKNMCPDLLGDVSIQTIQHRLRCHLKLPSWFATFKPLLTETMQHKWVRFARTFKEWTAERWKHVLWSDESTFQVVTSHALRVRRPSQRHCHNPQDTVKTIKQCFSNYLGLFPWEWGFGLNLLPAKECNHKC